MERVFGQKADGNLCVTSAMSKWLADEWSIHATVLYDKPPLFFHPTALEDQHELFGRVADQFTNCQDVCVPVVDAAVDGMCTDAVVRVITSS